MKPVSISLVNHLTKAIRHKKKKKKKKKKQKKKKKKKKKALPCQQPAFAGRLFDKD